MPDARRDKTTGLPLPSPVVPATSLCFKMTIPNALEYRTALKGILSDLGRAWTWSQTVGQDNNAAYEAAAIWRAAIAQAVFEEDCEADMSCADVANCIETNPTVINNIQNIVRQSAAPGSTATPGQPMTPTQYNAVLNPAVDCDLDVLWAQCIALIEYLVQAGTDTLEKLEVYSNAVEGAQFIELVPLLGTLIDEAQIDQALEFVDFALSSVQEAYEAAVTTPLKQEIACALFCEVRDNCEITIESVWNVLNERLGGALNPSGIDDLASLAEAVIAVGTSPALPVELWLAFLMGSAKFAGYLGVKGIDATLNIVLKLAINDANNDWTVVCVDCPESAAGFIVYGDIGTTTVEQAGNTYTITGGFIGGGGGAFLYVGASLDGVGVPATMTYSSLDILNNNISDDWGNEGGSYVSAPPTSAPPPNVHYAGGITSAGTIASVQIVIETDMPYQGMVQGA